MALPPPPWQNTEGDIDEFEGGEDDDFGFTNIDEDLAKYGDDELIAEALRNGDLRQYARDIEGDLRKVERDSIADYVHESENLAHLHMKIRSCDQLLEGMETVLGSFQGDLGKVTEEIKGLQQRASEMGVKDRNRREVNTRLTSIIDMAAVSPSLIHTITEADVNDAYIEHLLLLNKKLLGSGSAVAQSLPIAGNMTVQPVLEDLKIKAVDKARGFLLHKIYSLGRPKTNFQILQQSVLLKFRHLLQFLREHNQQVYEEVRGEYIRTMGEIYCGLFRAQCRHMARCHADVVGPEHTLGADEVPSASAAASYLSSSLAAVSSPFASIFGGSPVRPSISAMPQPRAGEGAEGAVEIGGVFALKGRDDIIAADGVATLMKTQVGSGKHRIEVLFKAALALLLASAEAEQQFVSDLYRDDARVVMVLFRPSLAALEEHFQAQVTECHDAVGLLLMIRIMQDARQRVETSDCQLDVLISFLDALKVLVWPRFKALLDSHVASVRSVPVQGLLKQPGGGGLTHGDKFPLGVTRRFAELSASLLLLRNAEVFCFDL